MCFGLSVHHHLLEDQAIATRTRPACQVRCDLLVTVTNDLKVDWVPLLPIPIYLSVTNQPLIQRNGCSLNKANTSIKSLILHDIQNFTPSIGLQPYNKFGREAVDCLNHSLTHFHHCSLTNWQVTQESSNWSSVFVWAQPFQFQR